jgi:hypothetical protein
MALGRVIQEKSNPINDVSKNVRDDLVRYWGLEDGNVRAVYSPTDSFYLLLFPSNNLIYCFDTRGLLENGAYRVTTWTTDKHKCFAMRRDDTLLIGNTRGINEYTGYSDNEASYPLRYYSNPLSFGDSSRVKFPKKITPTLIGGSGSQIRVKWAYDFTDNYKTVIYDTKNTRASYYGQAEFNVGEFTSGSDNITAKRINTTGSGNLITVGLETSINGSPLSIQEFNIQATMGRIY